MATRTRRWVWLAACIAAAGAAYVYFGRAAPPRGVPGGSGPAAAATPVQVAPAKKADVEVALTGLGSVTPLNTVTVKTRVDGQLTEVLFREGQLVRRGDVLAAIDRRPFEAQLKEAEGQRVRDEALLRNARLDLDRYRALVARDYITKQQLDTQAALVHQYEGAVETDRGQIDAARLQLTYCRITAPLDGRVGLRQVDAGNMVHATDTTGLVVITQVQPITVVFSIPEDGLPKVLDKLRTGQRMPVEIFDRDQTHRLATGSLLSADNQIDPNTGTVRLKALFPNTDNGLFPNQFVNARLVVDVLRGVTVVPAAAVQRGSRGTYVYVVKPDRTAGMRAVVVGPTERGEAAVTTGLSPGELVVVEGAERLKEGARVEPRPTL